MFWFYNLLVLLTVPLFPLIKLTVRKRGEIYLKDRLSSKIPNSSGKILLHASSVGEVHSVAPLVEKLKHRITITTFTDYGLERVRKLFPEVPSRVLPLDFYPLTKAFLKRGNFSKILIYETEIWPSLLKSAKELKIPVFFVSGKLSERSYKRLKLFKKLLKEVTETTTFLAKSEEDGERAKEIGFKRVKVVGNLKLAYQPPKEKAPLTIKGNRKVVIWGSTHEGEEEIAVKVHRELKRTGIDNLLTIIAPRHVNRKLILPGKSMFRTEGTVVEEEIEFYVINTVGELSKLYSYGDLIVIGGSFVKGIGGHNPVEAASLRKAVITGPFVEKVEEVVKFLGIPKVKVEQLPKTLQNLLEFEEKRKALAEKVHKNYLEGNKVIDKILKEIGEEN